MSQQRNDNGTDRLARLGRAVDLFLTHRSSHGSDADLIAQNADLEDLLEPLLAPDSPGDPGEETAQPRFLGDFQLVREIGRGGMGVVYEARQASLSRRVALKVLPAHLSLTPARIERFRREAAAIAKLRHPGIVPVHAVGEAEGTHWFAMELVEGASLGELLKKRGSPDETLGIAPELGAAGEAAEIVAQVAEALHSAHESGIVHRDVKPQNIMIDGASRARIVDFGLAKDFGITSASRTSEFAGTPSYTSPEMASGSGVDGRADVFSLGVVLYELLTATRPFDAGTDHEILQRVATLDPVAPRACNRRAPPDLETICLKALEKRPERRYASAAELAGDLRRFLRHEPIEALPLSLRSRTVRLVRRHPRTSWGIGTVVLASCVGLVVLVVVGETERRRREAERNSSRRTLVQLIGVLRTGNDQWQPGTSERFENQLTSALATGERLLPNSPAAYRHEVGSLYVRAGAYRLHRAPERARRELDRGVELLRDAPPRSRAAIELANGLQNRVVVAPIGPRRIASIRSDLAEALEHQERALAAAGPDMREAVSIGIAITLLRRAGYVEVPAGDTDAAIASLQEATRSLNESKLAEHDVLRDWIQLMIHALHLQALTAAGRFDGVEPLLASARKLVTGVRKERPLDVRFRQLEALLHWTDYELARHRGEGRPERALQRAYAMREKIARDFPNLRDNNDALAALGCRLGSILITRKRFDKALQVLDTARSRCSGSTPIARHKHALILSLRAYAIQTTKPAARQEIEAAYRAARAAFDAYIEAEPGDRSARVSRAGMQTNEAGWRLASGELGQGRALLDAAVPSLRETARQGDAVAREYLRAALRRRLDLFEKSGDATGLVAACTAFVEHAPRDYRVYGVAAWKLCRAIALAEDGADTGAEPKSDFIDRCATEAVAALDRSVALGAQRVELIPTSRAFRRLHGRADFGRLVRKIRNR